MLIGRTDAKAEAPIVWPLDARADSLEKTLMLGKIEGRRRRGTEDETAGWHHRLNGHEFEKAPGAGDGQGGLASCREWGREELDTTGCLNNCCALRRHGRCPRGRRRPLNVSENQGPVEDRMQS